MNRSQIKNKLLPIIDIIENRNLIQARLIGGLCNKLYCLMSACDIAIKKNYKIIDPEFGWIEKKMFSDIYDLEYFNESIEKITGVKDLIVKSDDQINEKKIIRTQLDLWEHSEKLLSVSRESNKIFLNSPMVFVLKSLRLNKNLQDILDNQLNNKIVVQFRVESDWQNHVKHHDFNYRNEIPFSDSNDIIKMLRVKFKDFNEVFFTTGEKHTEIERLLSDERIKSNYFYDSTLEYEINAAINFEIIANSDIYVGISRSTFSNLLTLKRQLLLENNNNYIYNYNNEIVLRNDFGLYPHPFDSINKTPILIS